MLSGLIFRASASALHDGLDRFGGLVPDLASHSIATIRSRRPGCLLKGLAAQPRPSVNPMPPRSPSGHRWRSDPRGRPPQSSRRWCARTPGATAATCRTNTRPRCISSSQICSARQAWQRVVRLLIHAPLEIERESLSCLHETRDLRMAALPPQAAPPGEGKFRRRVGRRPTRVAIPCRRIRQEYVNGLGEKWSGREDSNLRPPAPKAGALPGCATPRHFAGTVRKLVSLKEFSTAHGVDSPRSGQRASPSRVGIRVGMCAGGFNAAHNG